MTISCTECRTCGDCYPKETTCAVCGGEIWLLDDACPTCGEPITEEMRLEAREAFKKHKSDEFDMLFPNAAKLRARRAHITV